MAETATPDLLKAQTEPLQASLHELTGLADGFGRAMTTAFKRSVIEGKDLDDVLRSLALSLSGKALAAALQPIGQGLGGVFSGIFSGFGGLNAGATTPSVSPLTRTGTVAAPGYLAVPDGSSLTGGSVQGLGPLAGRGNRSSAAAAGGAIHVSFNVTARDAESFRRSEAEISAMLARVAARGRRGL